MKQGTKPNQGGYRQERLELRADPSDESQPLGSGLDNPRALGISLPAAVVGVGIIHLPAHLLSLGNRSIGANRSEVASMTTAVALVTACRRCAWRQRIRLVERWLDGCARMISNELLHRHLVLNVTLRGVFERHLDDLFDARLRLLLHVVVVTRGRRRKLSTLEHLLLNRRRCWQEASSIHRRRRRQPSVVHSTHELAHLVQLLLERQLFVVISQNTLRSRSRNSTTRIDKRTESSVARLLDDRLQLMRKRSPNHERFNRISEADVRDVSTELP